MSESMKRDFASRDDMIAYLRELFPNANETDAHVSEMLGGRAAAESQLEQIQPKAYAKTRNYTDGDVTRLSPYIRHGVLTLAEVRDEALERTTRNDDAEKFIQELAYRDFFQRVYHAIGDGIWENQEDWKTGFNDDDYSPELPEDIIGGETGLACVDGWRNELVEMGYLHNHTRMYFAAYVVHWRRIHWRAGAQWFLVHLLDGDPASNNLSWQWVASTFSHKPYYFNRENIERFTNGVYCRQCPVYGHCVFEGTYDEVAEDLFPNTNIADEQRDNVSRRDRNRSRRRG